MRYKFIKKNPILFTFWASLSATTQQVRKADDIPYLLRYQGLAVDDYGAALDALNLGHPRLSIN